MSLPPRASLEQLRKQARELLNALRSQTPEALHRYASRHPQSNNAPATGTAFRLADAQLILARENGFTTWTRLKKHVESDNRGQQLREAINRNDLAAVQKMIQSDSSLLHSPIGYAGGGPLTWAAECRGAATPPSPERLEIAHFLIRSGADVHEGGDGPLMRAVLADERLPMMELLLIHGADVNALWAGRYPIIHAPCETLAPRALQWILEHGADPNARDGENRDGGTPLDMVIGTYSRSFQQRECARLLIEAGGWSRYDSLPVTEIHRGRLDRLESLLRDDPALVSRRFPGLDYGGTGYRALQLTGGTLLHVAAEYGDLDAARLLLEHGADVNAPALVDEAGVGGQTPLFHAVTQYFDFGVPMTEFLVQQGADLSKKARVPGRYESPGEVLEVTPLGYAARFPYEPFDCDGARQLLLRHRAPAGDLWAAARLGLVEEVKSLLAAGANPDQAEFNGETARAAAEKHGHTTVMALL